MKMQPVIKLVVRMFGGVVLGVITIYLLVALVAMLWPTLGGGTRGKRTGEHSRFAAMFKSGDTNAPLLAMDWFSDHGVYFCRVSQSGNANSARDVGHAIQGGNRQPLRFSPNSTNRQQLEAAINCLPASSKNSLSKERQILASGIRSNQWFECVYDRANVPPELEKLYELSGAYLGWFIPAVGSQPEGVQHGMSGHDPNTFAIAKDTSTAVSVCLGYGLQIWNLRGSSAAKISSLETLPYPWKQNANEPWPITTLSPDGQILIIAARDKLFAVDWQNQKLLWHTNEIAWGNTYHANGKTLAVGNNGRSLFIAEANSVERWNLVDGAKLGVLATNSTGIKFLQTSLDGSLLVAGYGDNSFTAWATDKDAPVFQFTEPAGASCIGVSPDGQKIVLNAFRQRKFVVYDWKLGERKEFPLRTPYASSSAYSMCWSPDGKRLAAHVDTYPSSIIIYETTTWKPIAQWKCGAIGSNSEFVFNKEGNLFQVMDGEISCLRVARLKELGD